MSKRNEYSKLGCSKEAEKEILAAEIARLEEKSRVTTIKNEKMKDDLSSLQSRNQRCLAERDEQREEVKMKLEAEAKTEKSRLQSLIESLHQLLSDEEERGKKNLSTLRDALKSERLKISELKSKLPKINKAKKEVNDLEDQIGVVSSKLSSVVEENCKLSAALSSGQRELIDMEEAVKLNNASKEERAVVYQELLKDKEELNCLEEMDPAAEPGQSLFNEVNTKREEVTNEYQKLKTEYLKFKKRLVETNENIEAIKMEMKSYEDEIAFQKLERKKAFEEYLSCKTKCSEDLKDMKTVLERQLQSPTALNSILLYCKVDDFLVFDKAQKEDMEVWDYLYRKLRQEKLQSEHMKFKVQLKSSFLSKDLDSQKQLNSDLQKQLKRFQDEEQSERSAVQNSTTSVHFCDTVVKQEKD